MVWTAFSHKATRQESRWKLEFAQVKKWLLGASPLDDIYDDRQNLLSHMESKAKRNSCR